MFLELAQLEFTEYLAVSQSLARILRVETVRSKEVMLRDPNDLGDFYDMFFRKVNLKNLIRAKMTDDSIVVEFLKTALKFEAICSEFIESTSQDTTRLGREIVCGELLRILKIDLEFVDAYDRGTSLKP